MPDRLSMRKVRAVSGAADQVFSSMSNGLIIYAVAVVTVPEDFGQIALLLTLLAAAIGVLRGALGTPLLLTAARDQSDIRREGSFAITSALLASPVVGGIMWVVQGSGIKLPALLIIVAAPIVLVGDVLRYVAIAEGRPHIAALWDGVWFAGSAALLVTTWLHLPMATAANLIGGWVAMALIALVGLLTGVRVAPRFKELPAWFANGWQHRARYGTESGLEQTTAFAVLLFAALVLSPGVTAALRGATALLAPLAILTSAIPLVIIPDSRRQNMTPPQVWKSLARIASASSSGAILMGAALYLLPGTIGQFVLGHTFGEAQAVTPVIAFEYAVGSWIIAVTIHLRTFNRSADALRLKAGYMLLMILAALCGGLLLRTAAGVAMGIATATTVVTAISLLLFKPWATPGGGTRVPEERESAAPGPLCAIRTDQGLGPEDTGIVAATTI